MKIEYRGRCLVYRKGLPSSNTSFPYPGLQSGLLSKCFCAACSAAVLLIVVHGVHPCGAGAEQGYCTHKPGPLAQHQPGAASYGRGQLVCAPAPAAPAAPLLGGNGDGGGAGVQRRHAARCDQAGQGVPLAGCGCCALSVGARRASFGGREQREFKFKLNLHVRAGAGGTLQAGASLAGRGT